MLNSRPLCAIENYIEYLEVLTPGHFLIGRTLNVITSPEFKPTKSLQIIQEFLKKWVQNCLNSLQQRPLAT
jgi:hypothetical protein